MSERAFFPAVKAVVLHVRDNTMLPSAAAPSCTPPTPELVLLLYYHSTSEFFVITMVAYPCRCVMGSQVSRRPSFRIHPNELCKE
jgi:hypothetical protein